MRLLVIISILAVAYGRPQQNPTSSEWKPIETDQQLRDDNHDDHDTRTQKASSSTAALKESVKQVANQLASNNTQIDITMDTRTPPKIKIQNKNIEKKKPEIVENSHPGVAVPIDVDAFYESTTQKRPVIYRNENKTPTPVSGISTWILLSGQSTTLKPVRKSTIKTTTSTEPADNKTTITDKPVKGTIKIKPLTTKKPKTTTSLSAIASKISSTTESTTESSKTDKNNIMTKIKASVLSNAYKNKTTSTTVAPTTKRKTTPTTTTTIKQKTTTAKIETISNNNETNELNLESKDGGIELIQEKSVPTTKRPRRPPTNKRKKNNNKNRRRKPTNVTASEKIDTNENTKIAIKQKPIGTQIYNYLSREIMPTVGVGLVGLMVTAGLASYFLYPFGGLRRAYDAATDRKDYYYDEYASGGMREEELIGKVIAGMPETNDYHSNTYRTHLGRKDSYKNDINYNYRNSESFYPYSNDFKTVSVGSKIGYGRDVIAEHQKETGYVVDEGQEQKNQFVVGNIPKEFELNADPVPEHGPRSIRMKRYAQNDKENEIIDFKYEEKEKYATVQPYYRPKTVSTSESSIETSTEFPDTTEATIILQPDQPNFFTFIRNLIELKVRLGLELLLKTTDSFSKYLRGVQERVNNVMKEENSRTPLH